MDWTETYRTRDLAGLRALVDSLDAFDEDLVAEGEHPLLPAVRDAARAAGQSPTDYLWSRAERRAADEVAAKLKLAEDAKRVADQYGGVPRDWGSRKDTDPELRRVAASMRATVDEARTYVRLKDSDDPVKEAEAVDMARRFGQRWAKVREERQADLVPLRNELRALEQADRQGTPDPGGRREKRVSELRMRLDAIADELKIMESGGKVQDSLPPLKAGVGG